MFFKSAVRLLSILHLCIVRDWDRDFILWNSSEYVLMSWMLFLKKGAPWQLFSMYRCLLLILHICNQLLHNVIHSSDYVLLSLHAAPDKGAPFVLSLNNLWWLFSAVCYFNHFNVLCLLSCLHMLQLLIDIYPNAIAPNMFCFPVCCFWKRKPNPILVLLLNKFWQLFSAVCFFNHFSVLCFSYRVCTCAL